MTAKVTLVDRNEFDSALWSQILRLGHVERVLTVNRAEDLLIPIMNSTEPLLLDVVNLHDVVKRLQDSNTWRLIERALLSSSGAMISGVQYGLHNGQLINIPYVILTEDQDTQFWLNTLNDLRSQENIGPGVGNWNPENVVLMVGERPGNEPPVTKKDYAFLSSKGSSAWLCKELDAANIIEPNIYWINAYNRNDEPTDASFVDILKPKAIYALGAYAGKWCSENAFLHHFTVAHPQYWKRFKSNKPYPLIEMVLSNTQHRHDRPALYKKPI